MPRIKIETTQNVVLQAELASLGDRVVAALIDYALIVVYFTLVATIFEDIGGGYFDSSGRYHESSAQFLFYIVAFIPYLLYFIVFEYYMDGKSLGKLALKIQVVSLDGGPLTIGQVFVRTMFRLIDEWGVKWMLLVFFSIELRGFFLNHLPIAIIGVLFIAFSKREQRIGDMAAGTVLVKLRKRATLKDTVFHNVEADYKPVYTNVLMLSDYDIRAIKEAIMLAERYNNYKYAKELAIQVKKHLKIEKKVPATSFLKTILKDYNYLANQAA